MPNDELRKRIMELMPRVPQVGPSNMQPAIPMTAGNNVLGGQPTPQLAAQLPVQPPLPEPQISEEELFSLSPEDQIALINMVYGENASEDAETIKMTAQTAINRLRSPRDKEFGATMPEVLSKGYNAVKDNTDLYQQGVTGKFPDDISRNKHADIGKQVESIIGDQDFGEAQFFFRPEEEEAIKNNPRGKKIFNFDNVKSKGKVGVYNTYGY